MPSKSTTLMSSIVEERVTEGPMQSVRFSLSGEPHAQALVTAVVADYHRRTERPQVTEESLRALTGSKVSLARFGESAFGASSVQGEEGTVFEGSGGRLALLPKGARKKGFVLNPGQVLDVVPGYGKLGVIADRIAAVRATFPKVEQLTREHLLALPEEAPSPAQIGLAVFGTRRGPEGNSPAAVWLLHSYMREDDIAEGYLIVRPEHGVSEHGSIYGRDLLRVGGVILDPPAMSFAEAMALGDLTYDEALSRFVTA